MQNAVDCTTIGGVLQILPQPHLTDPSVTRVLHQPVLLAVAIFSQAIPLAANDKLAFFESKIRPALVEHCYECHSENADSIGGKLLLDTREGILRGGESGTAVIAGNPESSLIFQAIRHDGIEMPPDTRLPETVVKDFERWIQDGAEDPRMKAPDDPSPEHQQAANRLTESGSQHWSFMPRLNPSMPHVKNTDWVKNSIDFFTLSAMEKSDIQPTQDALPRTLLRRLHFDLTGLPPTFQQIQDFEQAYREDRDQAIANVVNQQLASPQFGIRWGRHWLDVARYGESNGDDGLGRNASFPHAWRYRNYVVDAINNDVPYDRFITEQIAGDLLPYLSAEERNRLWIATGFLAIGSKPAAAMNNNFAMDIVDDQINVISTGVMGLSVACARCHDHKHDPISTRDYYALAGIFTSTETLYGAAGNEKLTAPPTALHELTSKLNAPENQTSDRTAAPELPTTYEQAIQDLKPMVYAILNEKPKQLKHENINTFDSSTFATVENSQFRSVITGEQKDYTISFWFRNELKNDARPITAYLFSRAAWNDKALPGDHLGIGGKHEASRTGKLFVFNGNEAKQSIAGSTVIPANTWNHITYTREGDQVKVFLNGRLEIDDVLPAKFGTSRDVSVSIRSDQFAPLQGNIGHLAILDRAISNQDAELLHAASGQPRGPEPVDILGLAMGVQDKNDPNNCKIHINGETRKLGEEIPRGILSIYSRPNGGASTFGEIPHSQSGRLQLAKWITSPEHPQTARVIANRIWLHLFGKGIVATPNDFGIYGARPTHPELLDHLANELIAGQWSLKQLIRKITLSHTYQLDSQCEMNNYQKDPSNTWLSRHQRRRLDAESIRDAVLSTSGTLDCSIRSGSDVETVDMLINWPPGESTNLHRPTTRRSLFLCMLRHAPPKELAAFDLPDGVQVVSGRETTTLPTQSLFLMNSDFMVDQTTALAKELSKLESDEEKIDGIFLSALQRKPLASETIRGLSYIQSMTQMLTEEVTDPDRRQIVVWASYAQAVMSSNEFRYID